MATDKISKIVDAIKELTVVEAFELKKSLEDEFGVEAAAPMAMMAVAPVAAEAAEEQTEFDVMLNDAGSEKIAVIRVVKEATGLGLKEAKELVEAAPKQIVEAVSKDDAEALLAKLAEAGATAELK